MATGGRSDCPTQPPRSRRSPAGGGRRHSWVRAAAAAVYDDVGGGRLWFRRRALPHRPTYNVVAEAGDPDGARTVVFLAHHDAAHSGLVFHPALPRAGMNAMPAPARPGESERADPLRDLPRAAADRPLGAAGPAPAAGCRALLRAGATCRDDQHRDEPGGAGGQRQPQRGGHRRRPGARPAREPARGRAGPARLDRLGGVLHGGHAGLRPAPLRRPRPRHHRVRLPGVRGLTGAVRGGGGGDAEDALVHGRDARAPRPRRTGRRRAPAARVAHGRRH